MVRLSFGELANFCKRKGFVYPSGDLYGGFAGFFDFGPLGVEFKDNIKSSWWQFHVRSRDDVVGIDGSIITNPKVWEASGHVDSFVDYIVREKKTGDKFKVDAHEREVYENDDTYVVEGSFNPMFTTNVGPDMSKGSTAYLRPETAQLIFTNVKLVSDNARLKLPFGIGQMGKSFRNEVAPRNFLFRLREFEQMELEYFIDPSKKNSCPYDIIDISIPVLTAKAQEKGGDAKLMRLSDALKDKVFMLPWHAYWISQELHWFFSHGANPSNFRLRQHTKDEKSHYATDTWDIEYNFPGVGFKELQGIADRGTFDLEQHEKASKKDLKIMDEASGKKVLPMVVAEPALGVTRALLVFMLDAYSVGEKGNVVLKLSPKLAPIKAAVLPLVKKDEELVFLAKHIYNDIKSEWNVSYDESGSVGRRYARNDEVGTPFCITVDSDSLTNKDITIRNRDDGKQKRILIKDLKDTLRKLISGEVSFDNL